MNTALQGLAIVIRDLMEFNHDDIIIGRYGFKVNDFESRQVVVDSTGPATVRNTSETFDSTNEVITYSQQVLVPCSINFYGDTAYEDAAKFSLLLKSQSGYELQRDNEVSIFNVGQLIDVKMLTGEQYNGRIQLNLNVQITIDTDVDTLRIDEYQLDDFLYN